MTTSEALSLKEKLDLLTFSVPFFGLESVEDGPGTNCQAVVGVYVGIRGAGAHLMGLDPDAEEWESVEVFYPDKISGPGPKLTAARNLERWLAERYPNESFVLYQKQRPKTN